MVQSSIFDRGIQTLAVPARHILLVCEEAYEERLPGVLSQHRISGRASQSEAEGRGGHIVSQDGIEVDPSKVEAVRDWPVPKSVIEIHSFLGLAGYYRKFIQDFSSIVVRMTALTKKNAKFVWGPECQESFYRLKQALTTALVLAMPSG
ncbi:uncharacterized mitochondrial protein AtMg00860-like [Primulina huaijiensis]|uniref:uncharacterized mitochondrial protein AtMg00860-like n=1 Tax=Primulina huaijiensis TaxID=1492673 RepID=UPI003CC6F98E